MKNDKRRPDLRRIIDCLEGLLECALALFRMRGRKFVTIRSCLSNFHWVWTKIVQATELHLPGVEHLLNSGQKRHPDAMTELDPIKTEIFDFPQHFIARGMPCRVPASRKSDHRSFWDLAIMIEDL